MLFIRSRMKPTAVKPTVDMRLGDISKKKGVTYCCDSEILPAAKSRDPVFAYFSFLFLLSAVSFKAVCPLGLGRAYLVAFMPSWSSWKTTNEKETGVPSLLAFFSCYRSPVSDPVSMKRRTSEYGAIACVLARVCLRSLPLKVRP